MAEKFYTLNQVAKWLGCDVTTIQRLASRISVVPQLAESPTPKRGFRFVVTREQVQKLLVAYYSKKGATHTPGPRF